MKHGALGWLAGEIASLETQGLRRRLLVRENQQQAEIHLEGARLINFSSNDYLGLAADFPQQEFADAIKKVGWGSGASPLVTGRGVYQMRLEAELADFEGAEAVLLFGSGYAANVGAVTALMGRGDVIFSDARNHASIIDGCRLSGADVQVYQHADAQHLRALLRERRPARRRMIVTDSLFSMDGDFAPLAEIAELAQQHEAMLMVDEAHATGVFGANGRGLAEKCGVESYVDVKVGTLSKALGSVGGFVAGPQMLIDWLANRARSYVFSTAQPDAVAAVTLAHLKIVQSQPERRETLLMRAAALRNRLTQDGWRVGASRSQIVPILIGDSQQAVALSQALRERGMLAPAIRPPSVPADASLLRVCVTHGHAPAMLDQLTAALRAAKEEMRK